MAIADTHHRAGIVYDSGASIRPARQSIDQIERLAEEVAKRLDLHIADELTDLVRDALGGRIHYQSLDDWAQASDPPPSLYVHGAGDFDIFLPRFTSPIRDRFTIAHELGHYYLHSREGQSPLIAFRRDPAPLDWEANAFAAALIMPHASFESACREGLSDESLAARFGVMPDVARVRKHAVLR